MFDELAEEMLSAIATSKRIRRDRVPIDHTVREMVEGVRQLVARTCEKSATLA